MPEPTAPRTAKTPPRRRSWWRRLLRVVAVLILVFAVFHRPIILTAARLALIQIASKQNVTLDVHFSGTIFTNLTIRDVSALPNGKGKSPVEKIAIERVVLEYSLVNLIKHGVGEFLSSYEIHHADLVFAPQPSETPKDTQQKKSLAEDLNNLLGQPALYADRVVIEDLSLTVHSPQDTTEVRGINLYLHPWEPGYFRIAKIAVPGLPPWENLQATTRYAQRNLYIEGLQLSPELGVDALNFDASQRSQDKGSLLLKAHVFGGSLEFSMAGTKLKAKGENLEKSYDTALRLDIAGVDLPAAAAYFKAPAPPVSRLTWLKVRFAGQPEKPRTWKGEAGLRADALAFGETKVDYAELNANFADGIARVSELRAAMGQTGVTVDAQAQLPESINDFSKTEADASFRLGAPALDELTRAFMPQPVGGAVTGGGKIGLHGRVATVEAEVQAANVQNTDLGLESAGIKLQAKRQLDVPAGAGPLEGTEATAAVTLQGLRFSTFTADSAVVNAEVAGEQIRLQKFGVVRGENSISAQGTYRVPKAGQPAPPIEGEFAIQAPKLAEFGLGQGEHILGGHLAGEGRVKSVNNVYSGRISLNGGDFTYGDFTAGPLVARVDVANNEANIEQFELRFKDAGQIGLAGKAGLTAPFTYEGALLVLFKDLTVLQPLLTTFGVKDALSGALDLTVESQGKGQPLEPSGRVKFAANKVKYGTTALTEAKISAIFAQNFAETTELKAVMGETSFEGGIEWRDDRLRLKDINLMQGSQKALSGFVLVPFEPKNPQGPLPYDKRVAINVNADQLDLEKLLTSLGQTAPASGTISANVIVGGTLLKPTAHVKVSGRQLRSKAAAKLKPAELDFNAHYSEKDLTLDVLARLPDVQPLTIKGHVPIDLEAAIQDKKLDPDLPLDLTVKLPSSSLAFVSTLVPTVRSIAGTAAIDAHVSGTVKQPKWGGSVGLKLEYARLKNESVPAIGSLDVGLAFTQEALNIQRFRGEIGGGSFELGGKIGLAKLTEPTFDLRLKSNSVLVKRDDSITIRVDSDITVAGPMAAGKLAGTVWVTQSRFFRDIDILPIALPGRPKPQAAPRPREVASQGGSFSLGPPLSGWTFDLAIKTRPNDPFRIIGNLANGAASIDLKFGGTGAKPWLEGQVRVDSLVASLPFSKLEVQRGFITFKREAFAMPTLEIFAESELRDYHINAYIYGSVTDPQLNLTSEPPLPQQDLLALIATGVTTQELTSNSDALASRAAVLLFQQLYHKIFKKKAPSENSSAHDRFSLDVGAVDSRTGRQELAASFRLGDKTYLVGDVDIAGQFSGRIKYLLRFR